MKKTFLIAGLIACVGATNGYAAITISQDDASDITISVARATKIKPRVAPKPTSTNEPVPVVIEESDMPIKLANGGQYVSVECPDGVSRDCKVKCEEVTPEWEKPYWKCECRHNGGEGPICSPGEDVVSFINVEK